MRTQLALQQLAELFCLRSFGLSGSFVRQRRLEFRQFAPAELVVQPCRPFFLKRFHKRLSVSFAISCAHKTAGTSLCRSNIPTFLRSRDIASHRFPSLKSLRGVPAKAGQLPFRSGHESRLVPWLDGATLPFSEPFWMPDQSPSVELR